ncbi:MAG: hypothetical protein FWG69_05225 [Oscillospiraceae bacterium]|nr:hypothetical protein [Oscillospiraceae bacterium]
MKRIAGTKNDRTKLMLSTIAIIMGCVLLIISAPQGTFTSPSYPEILYFEKGNPVYRTSVNKGTALNKLGLPESLRAVFPISANSYIDENVQDEAENAELAPETSADESADGSVDENVQDEAEYGELAEEDVIIDEPAAEEVTEDISDEYEEETTEETTEETPEETPEETGSGKAAGETGFSQTVPLKYSRYGYIAPENEADLRKSGQLVIYTLYNGDGSRDYRIHGTYDGENESWYACGQDGDIFGIILNIPVTWYGKYDADTPDEYTFTARIAGFDYSGEMPVAAVTVHQAAQKPVRSPDVTITTNKGLLADLGKLKTDQATGFIKNEDWVVVKTYGNGVDKAIMLARRGGGNLGKFGSSNAYEGSDLQKFYTDYYIGWGSPLKDLALVPALGDHANLSSAAKPKEPLEIASTTTKTKDIVFALSRQDMVSWNNESTTPVRDAIRNNWPRSDQSSHMWLRTKGTGTSFVWELNNTGQGYIADAAQCPGNINRVPAVWVKAADVWRNISIHYIDTNGKPVSPPDYNAYKVLYDESFTLNKIPVFAGYRFTDTWKAGASAAVNSTLPVTVSNIRENTDIYLIYEKTAAAIDFTVTVHYIDKANGSSIGNPSVKAYLVSAGNSFTLPEPDIQNISGYDYKEWKVGLNGAVKTTSPIKVENVLSNTDIYLLYEKKATASADIKNAYINDSAAANNGTADNPVQVELNDRLKYTITADNIKKPSTSGAKYDILFVLDWSRSMDAPIYESKPAKQYERDVMLDMFDFITKSYPSSRVAVMGMNSTGMTNSNNNTHIQFESDFLTPAQYWGGMRDEISAAFDEPWKNETEDPSIFLKAATGKIRGLGQSAATLYGSAQTTKGGSKYTIPRKPAVGENSLSERTPVIVFISDFQIPQGQNVGGERYWDSIMRNRVKDFASLFPNGILQTVRLDHNGNNTGGNAVYSTPVFDNLMRMNVSPGIEAFKPELQNGQPNWGFTKVSLGTLYIDALKNIKNDFSAIAPPAPGQGTVITDKVPEGLEVDISGISHNGVYNSGTNTVTWDLFNENDGKITVWFTATVKDQPKRFENTAKISAIDGTEINTNTTYHKTGRRNTDVTITKTVEGLYGNKTKEFEFYVYLISPDPSRPLESDKIFNVIGGSIPGSGAAAPAYTTLPLTEGIVLKFSLSHGQKLTIKDIPSHLLISIVEEDDKNYSASFMDSKDGSTGGNIASFRQVDTDDGTRTFDYVNERIAKPITGITSGWVMEAVLLIAVLLILAGVTGIGMLRKRIWKI